MVKKGDDGAVDDDDNVVRISVSQTQVTATLCTEEFIPWDSVFIAVSAFQTGKNGGGGNVWPT
jgi:CRISPR/Cas system CMR subunit Cmr4 (Cas7 group RAMP superfamily)